MRNMLDAGQRHESPKTIPLMERALHRIWPEGLAWDKGYSSSDLRTWLQERDVAAVIPQRKDELGPNEYDRDLYRERPKIDQTINGLKRFRRVATWYEKLTESYPAMVTLAMTLEWI